MRRVQRVVSGMAALGAAIVLAGCSMDALIWGPEGAQVIEATEELVTASVAGDATPMLCADSVAEMGESSDWAGLSAGEPERFTAKFWVDQAALDPQWNINLEGLPDGGGTGKQVSR